MGQKDNLDLTKPLCISVPAAAKLLGVSRNTGYEMARLGQLPIIRCGQRRLVVPRAALIKMLEEGGKYYGQEKKEQITITREVREGKPNGKYPVAKENA